MTHFCRYECLCPDGVTDRVAVKELDAAEDWDMAVQEARAMEPMCAYGMPYALPYYGLYQATAPPANGSGQIERRVPDSAFLVMG